MKCLGLSLLQSGYDIECTADEAVICDLGNPFKSNQKVTENMCDLSTVGDLHVN